MLHKFVAAVILVPLAIVIIAFAVANRQPVTIWFDPFSSSEPAVWVTLPLFAVIILALIIGVVIGGLASWLRQGKWRGAARRFERELHRLREKVQALEGAAGKPAAGPEAGKPLPRLQLRPPAR